MFNETDASKRSLKPADARQRRLGYSSSESTNQSINRRATVSASSDVPATMPVSVAAKTSIASGDSRRTNSELIINLSVEPAEIASRILCLFVATFDAKLGNVIQWRIPSEFNLDGVEFKAIPSGAHSVKRDYILFKHDAFFGAAAFASQSTDNEINQTSRGASATGKHSADRGVRTCSVGVLCATYANLGTHLRFLEAAVDAQIESPYTFGELAAYFERHHVDQPIGENYSGSGSQPESNEANSQTEAGVLNHSDSLLVLSTGANSVSSRSTFLKELRVHDSESNLYEFVRLFGVHIFSLWRLAVLRKRVLFYAAPPIGPTCYQVYWCAALANHGAFANVPKRPIFARFATANPVFLVSLVDIDYISGLAGPGWIACTSDRLFESKGSLYDAFVCAPNSAMFNRRRRADIISVSDPGLRYAVAVSSADRMRMRKLSQLIDYAETAEERDTTLRAYFTQLNTELLTALMCVANRPSADDRMLTAANLRGLQIDLTDATDREFLVNLVEMLQLELTVALDSQSFFTASLCPCCDSSSVARE